MMGSCGCSYLALLALWGGVNLAYLSWFFGKRQDLTSIETFLRK
jgi:hypothetical protein